MTIALQLFHIINKIQVCAMKFPFGTIFHLSITKLEHSKMENVSAPSQASEKRASNFPVPNYRPSKVLPHINEEYDFHINNRLLI